MSDVPRLRPLAPLSGAAHPVSDPPFWIGRDPSCALVLSHPGLAARHCVLVEREDGWWLRPQAPVTVAGRASTDPVRLQPDVVIELAPGLSFRFEEGESARVERAPVVVRREAQAVEPPRPRTPRPPRHPRKRERGPSTLMGGPTLVVAVVLLALAVGIGVALRRAQAPPALTPEEAALFQTLMTEATERMERGSTLLELGQPELALAEFARAINGVETSTLGRHPWVQARLATFEAAVGALYRARRMDVPARFGVDADGESLDHLFRSQIPRPEFERRVAFVFDAFRERYAREVVVTGRDHAEHLALYGAGSALDLRVRDLSPEQVAFLVDQFRALGVRVKDFSRDEVLQQQIESALARGLADRAGTGLHLHIDRFAERADAYTVD